MTSTDRAASLRAASERVRQAERALEQVRAQRNAQIWAALDAGMTAYRVAKATGLSHAAVRLIRDAR